MNINSVKNKYAYIIQHLINRVKLVIYINYILIGKSFSANSKNTAWKSNSSQYSRYDMYKYTEYMHTYCLPKRIPKSSERGSLNSSSIGGLKVKYINTISKKAIIDIPIIASRSPRFNLSVNI